MGGVGGNKVFVEIFREKSKLFKKRSKKVRVLRGFPVKTPQKSKICPSIKIDFLMVLGLLGPQK